MPAYALSSIPELLCLLGMGTESHDKSLKSHSEVTLTADAHFLPPAYLLMKSLMGPDLISPS